MDKLFMMKAFIQVAQRGSFSLAGRDLGTSVSLISKQIGQLELQLDARLFNRTSRAVSLTEIGEHYLEFCKRIFKKLDTERQFIDRQSASVEGDLFIAAPGLVSNMSISSALILFCRYFPKVRLHFNLGSYPEIPHDPFESGYDVCIGQHQSRSVPVNVRNIAEIPTNLLAAPEFLAANGFPQTPHELMNFNCLTHTRDPRWIFLSGGQEMPVRVPSSFKSNSYPALCSAAVSGLGIAQLPAPLVAPHVIEGRLQPILLEYQSKPYAIQCSYRADSSKINLIEGFLTFLDGWFKDFDLRPLQALVQTKS